MKTEKMIELLAKLEEKILARVANLYETTLL